MAEVSAKNPTLETVAAVAGVSKSTVSRVINNLPHVRQDIREAVERAIAQTGYVPNQAARSLVTRRTGAVALVVQEPDTTVFTDPYLSALIHAIADELDRTDVQLVVIMARSQREQARLDRFLRAGHVDGVLLTSTHGAGMLGGLTVPVVYGGRPLRVAEDTMWVDADNVGGARLAVEHLRERGRERIAMIAGPQDMAVSIDRQSGYRDALDPNSRPVIAYGDFSVRSGEQAMRQLLAWEPELDAVFVSSDLMALGALEALRANGRRVPEDVAVVGFDDVEQAGLADPPLTTVRQPIDEQGRRMVGMLLDAIAGNPGERAVTLPTSVIARQSS
ncbi:LacI family DNA-binding transcriptional regulator [Allokutzneria albata]|uniref:DNA-binding transcriptional regulator, LacI/PurR family n=1 Tax=Allokutzneria albata TaxID=211114 RepID=A0A1G9ZEE9_ALLAB|nr:LacI family DNA-binding transcriptional regulator [Allokutzneria albata]SDN19525.1 DNA-binding transcriptional regulator, LacI/PurR family [Allokutzneria albata]